MIVVDTSAVVAIFLREPEARRFAEAIEADDAPVISAANLLELSIAIRAKRKLDPAEAERWLDEFMAIAGMSVEPVTMEQVRAARAAHIAFGKGSGHPAQLNYGDCFAYALAKRRGAPLLSKGDDFIRTDIEHA